MRLPPERFVPVDGGALCLQAFGDPGQPCLVLVAGAAASMDGWDVDLCRQLADAGRHVIRYDHRDTGRSSTAPPGAPDYDAGRLGRDCTALVESLGVGPVHLVGISMGGGIAQAVALRRPELLAGLILISTTAVGGVDPDDLPGPTPEVQATFASPPPDPTWSDPESYADWVIAGERAFAGSLPLDEPRQRALARLVHARSRDVAAANNHWLAVGDGGDGGEQLDVRRIAVPTLVVHGSEDPLFPLPHGVALAEAIPHARLLVVPGMGHQAPPPETWHLVVPALVEHTARTGS